MADLHVHTLAVRSHRITCDSPVLVQHGMGHDAIMLDLDAEWDGLAVLLVLGPCGSAYAAKPREIRVKGRTVQNLWPAFNYADHGVTGSTDDTGLITMSGTADASSPSIKSIKIDLTVGKTSITPA